MVAQNLKLAGKEFVVIERADYERLVRSQRKRPTVQPRETPSLPEPDRRGLRPASQTLRAILGRDIVRDRIEAGLSQRELARRAGIRAETLSRIESGRHTPSIATVEKIDRALKR